MGVLPLSDIGVVWWSDRIMRSTVFRGHGTMASNETTTSCQTEKTLSRRGCGYSEGEDEGFKTFGACRFG